MIALAVIVLAVGVIAVLALAQTLPAAPALIEVAGARMARLSEGTIRYEDAGAGSTAVLFLHGFNGQLGYWSEAWTGLGDCGRKVRVDIPGFGGSHFDVPSYDLGSQARRVLEFLDLRGIRDVFIVGESMGGSLAAYIAATRPERVTGLALLAPSGYTGALRYRGPYGRLLEPGPLKAVATWLARTRFYRSLFPASKVLQGLTVSV